MKVIIDNQEDYFWITVKREPEKNAELNGEPIDITCDLSQEMEGMHTTLTSLASKCLWGENRKT